MTSAMRLKLEKAWQHCRVLGLRDTVHQLLVYAVLRPRDDGFDRRHGTDTGKIVALRYDEPPAPGERPRSFPTDPRVLRHALAALGIDHREFVFVDLGCGKGRALLCAAAFPFRQVLGVEWSADLCAIARRNIAVYPPRLQRCRDLHVHCGNVLDYQFPATDTVFYLFDPFGPGILRQVFDRIHASVRAAPRRVMVIFCGLGKDNAEVVDECFARAGVRVVRRHLALASWASWQAGEAGRPAWTPP